MRGKRKRKAGKQGNKGFRRGEGLENVQKCPGKGKTATWLFGQRVRPDFRKDGARETGRECAVQKD